MNILFFGTYDVKTTPRVQGLIDGFTDHGATVTQYNFPLPIDTATRVSMLQKPWKLPLLAFHIINCWLKLIIKAKKRSGFDAVVVGHLGQFDVLLARRLFKTTPLALDYMVSGSEAAKDRRLAKSWKSKLLTGLDNAALKAADIVIVDTEEHRQMLPDQFRKKGIVTLVGSPKAWFDAAIKPANRKKNPKNLPSLIFFGAYTPLQGAPTIGKALSELKHPWKVTMVGHGQDEQATKDLAKNSPADITWINWVDASKLPQLVAEHDVCLGVFGTGPKSFKVVPNKVYQGAAVGCAVITAATPPQERIMGKAALYVPAGDHAALAKTLDGLATNPTKLRAMQKAGYDTSLKHFTPEQIIKPLIEIIKTYSK